MNEFKISLSKIKQQFKFNITSFSDPRFESKSRLLIPEFSDYHCSNCVAHYNLFLSMLTYGNVQFRQIHHVCKFIYKGSDMAVYGVQNNDRGLVSQ